MRRKLRNLRRLAEIVFIFLAGCAQSPKVPEAELLELGEAAGCKLAIDRHVIEAKTCDEAQLWTNADPACAKWAPLDFRCRTHK